MKQRNLKMKEYLLFRKDIRIIAIYGEIHKVPQANGITFAIITCIITFILKVTFAL